MVRSSVAVAAVALAAAACAPKQKEAPPEPAAQPASSSSPTTYETIMREVAMTDEAWTRISVAAAGWVRHVVPGRSIGFLQPDAAPALFQDMIAEVTRRYGFRAVHPEEYKVTCDPAPPGTRAPDKANSSCHMAMADAIIQFNSMRMTRDSGYVGGMATQVPRGSSSVESSAFCITVVRHGTEWTAVRNVRVADPRLCPH